MTHLDKLEATASLFTDFECTMSVQIECTRLHFESLKAEIEDEYDLSQVEDVRISQEKIPNQLSNIYGVRLHKTLFLFHIKD